MRWLGFKRLAAALAVVSVTGAAHLEAQTLKSATPPRQRVHEMVTLHGEDFGTFLPGVSEVVFWDGTNEVKADTPYVWRKDFIQVRVPVGNLIGGQIVPISKQTVKLFVRTAGGSSNAVAFTAITQPNAVLSFTELTQLNLVEPSPPGFTDVSTVLGNPNFNDARTKDGEVADVNRDGFPDLIDNTSWASSQDTHSVLRINDRNGAFRAILMEPHSSGDSGTFATVIPIGGTFIDNNVLYDADFADLDNDELPDLIQGGSSGLIRVLMNARGGLPAHFLEQSNVWFTNPNIGGGPDDVAHTDLNHDGFVDVGIGRRFSNTSMVLVNSLGQQFGTQVLVTSTETGFIHDNFFTDADKDGFKDIVLVNESTIASSQVMFQDGSNPPNFSAGPLLTMPSGISVRAGIAGDLNGDGLDDIVLVGHLGFFPIIPKASVFINDPLNPGSYTRTDLPDGSNGALYDVELGDIDLDGDIDILAASILLNTFNGDDAMEAWLNSGDGVNYQHVTAGGATNLLPGLEDIQRLSIDLLDYDRDGDLDLYITGADGQNAIPFNGQSGRAPNQFYRNEIDPVLPALPAADGWMRDNVGDNGTTPNPEAVLWKSPDLWNRLQPDCAPTNSRRCQEADHQNPQFGQTNYLYAKIRNRSKRLLHHGLLEIHMAAAATGLAWPTDFTKVGEIPVLNLGGGEVQDVGPLLWDPPNPSPSDHFCFYVRLVAEQDPIAPPETVSVFNNASGENGIVWRNVKVVADVGSGLPPASQTAPDAESHFIVRNADQLDFGDISLTDPIDLLLATQDTLIEQGTVDLILDPELVALWEGAGGGSENLDQIDAVTFRMTASKAGIFGIPMEMLQELPAALAVRLGGASPFGRWEVVVKQNIDSKLVGGTNLRVGRRWRLRVAEAEPLPVNDN